MDEPYKKGGTWTYRDLEDELLAVVLGLESVKNGRELGAVEFYCRNKSECAL